ncbi:MAG: hypothetical protein H6715_00195 [Myxococcales bacterium]|nr:hypothetical protein [Myxococcales bacterium]MCB9707384.1 hypothetical protein [Myxococcales bacterium]
MNTPLPYLLTAVLLATVGCSFGRGDHSSSRNFCKSDDDCPESSCDVSDNVCFTEDELNFQVALEAIVNNADQGSSTSVFSERFPLESNGEKNLEVGPLTDIYGTVRIAGGSERVQGALTFLRESSVKTLESSVTVQTLPEVTVLESGEEIDFATALLTGRYEVHIQPTETLIAALPPMDYELELLGDLMKPVVFPYPALTSLCRFAGTVVNDQQQGLDGFQVRAIDRESLKTVSSVATTQTIDAAAGTFVINLPKEVQDYLLVVGPSTPDMIYPEVTLDPDFLFPQPGCQGNHVLVVPAPKPTVSYGARITTNGPEPLGVGNAVVILTSKNVLGGSHPSRILRVSTLSNVLGEFGAKLLPGSYEMVVRPESSAVDFGVFAGTLHVSESGEVTGIPSPIALPKRHSFKGKVNDIQGNAMQGAVVQAVAQQRVLGFDAWPAAAYNRSNQTQTDASGGFLLLLDVGRYDLVIQTPSDSGFPWVVIPDVDIQGDAEAQSEAAFALVTPVAVKGMIRNTNGTAVKGADVIAHGVILQGTRERSLPVGRTSTNDDGTYTLLLAPLVYAPPP